MQSPSQKTQIAKRWAQRLQDKSGNITLTTAVSLFVIISAVGVAVDYGRAYRSKLELQMAVDAAVLAAAPFHESEREAVATKILNANFGLGAAGNWTSNSDGTFSGTASATLNSSLTSLFGVSQIPVATTATARRNPVITPSVVQFKLKSVKGWFWKRVTLYKQMPGQTQGVALATFTYQATNLFNDGSGTTTPSTGTIDIGNDYEHLYLTMEVSPDGCPPGYLPKNPEAINQYKTAYWNPYKCIVGQKQAKIYSFRTDDPAQANHLFVDGKQQGTSVALDLVKCDRTLTHGWEDTEIYKAGAPAWKTQDFIFEVTGSSCKINANYGGDTVLVH